MHPCDTSLQKINAEKSIVLASLLFPKEEWIPHKDGIFIAKNRLASSHKEQAKLYREIADVRILVELGSIVYFLPEQTDGKKLGENLLTQLLMEQL